MPDEQTSLLMQLNELRNRYYSEAAPILERLAQIKARDFTVVIPVDEPPQELRLRLLEQQDDKL